MKNKNVEQERARHHAALKAMLPADSMMSGLDCWRKLRRFETKAGRLALQLCNGPEITEAEKDKIIRQVITGVNAIFGREVPGLFINLDPRGWALKLEPGSVPYQLHQDFGGYQILAPLID